MAEQWPLTVSANVAVLLGQFPIDNKSSKFSLLNLNGILFIFWLILAIICAQTVCLYQLSLLFVISQQEFTVQLSVAALLTYTWASYYSYFSWVFTLPKYLKVMNAIAIFDQKFCVKVKRRLGENVRSTLILFSWLFGACFTVAAFRDNALHGFEFFPFAKMSWLVQIFGPKYNLISLLITVHWSICQNTASLSTQYFISLAQAITARLSQIHRKIEECNFQELNAFSGRKANNKIFEIRSTIYKLDAKYYAKQISGLHDIFATLQNASSSANFAFVCFTSCFVALLTYILRFSLGDVTEDPVLLAAVIYDPLMIGQLAAVVNTGEGIRNEIKSLQISILELPPAPEKSDAESDLIALKHLVSNMKFQFTGCDYFKINRTTFTSVIGTIITYNVVFSQMRMQSGATSAAHYSGNLACNDTV